MRWLLITVIIVGCLAVGFAGGLVISKMRPSAPPSESPQVQPVAEQPKAAMPSAPPATVPAVAVVPPAAPEPEASDASADSAAPAATGSFDPNALLSTLKPADRQALQAAQIAQLMTQGLKSARYQLPINDKFRQLEYQSRGKNKLTDAQKNQLKRVMENLKPQIETAFKDTWAQQDQLFGQLTQLIAQGVANPEAAENDPQMRQKFEGLGKQIDDLNTAMQPQQQIMDLQVLSAMTPYLTPDQLQTLKAMPDQGGPNHFFFHGPPADAPPGN